MRRKLFYSLAVITIATLSSGIFLSGHVFAADARNFNAGMIMDDSVFTNSNALSVQDIQSFFNSKVPVCDSWGQQQSELGGGTRAQWLAAHSISVPITCLRDYYENPATGQNNYGSNIPAGAISAAQIIYNYAQQFHINPEVIIVTLQKENGLVTDDWPTPKEFRQAMGFGCPDHIAPGAPACDPNYGSFSSQVYQAARLFNGFVNNTPGWYIPFTQGNNYIGWSPDSNCGGSTVDIQDRATVALYSYTTYRPNQAALNAQYGTGGDSCSTYGNRNFYLFFTDWFGSTYADVAIASPLKVTSGPAVGLYTGVPTTVSFNVTNTRGNAINAGNMTVAVRDSSGHNYDYPLESIVVPPYGMVTYQASQVLPKEDSYTFYISDLSNGAWRLDYPGSSISTNPRAVTQSVVAMPTQTSSITIGNELHEQKDTPISFTVKNNSTSQNVALGTIGIGVRGPNGENLDLTPAGNVTLTPGQIYTYSATFRPPHPGSYRFFVIDTLNSGANWETNFPLPADNSVHNVVTGVAKPGLTVTKSLQTTATDPHSGQIPTMSFNLHNYESVPMTLGDIGIMGRDPQGRNVDPGANSVTLNPGEEKTISFPAPMAISGMYQYSIVMTTDGKNWTNGPAIDSGTITKQLTATAKPGITITQGPTIAVSSLHLQQASTISLKAKNYGDVAANIGSIGIMGRDPQGRNVDPGINSVTLNPGEERTISFSVVPQTTGNYTYGVIQTTDNGATWSSGPVADTNSVTKLLSVAVKPTNIVVSGVTASATSVVVGQSVTLSYDVKNFSGVTANLGSIGLMGREANGRNVDPGVVATTLTAGQTKTISFTFTPTAADTYRFALLGTQDGGASWNGGLALESSSQTSSVAITAH